jgi:inhibitor of cysteine peptidase
MVKCMTDWKYLSGLVAGIVVVAAILITGVILENPFESDETNELQKFSSSEEIQAFLQEHSDNTWYYRGEGTGMDVAMEEAMPAPQAAKKIATNGLSGDYSTTNIQVQGVDEADIVKNDGKYIYVISGSSLVIIDAYPADDAGIISKTDITGTPVELFIRDDRLVLFCNQQEQVFRTYENSVAPVPEWRQVTHAFTFSIKDREDPELVRDISLTGNYYDARLIGNHIYTITTDRARWHMDNVRLPEVYDGESLVKTPEIYYANIPAHSYVFNTLASFDIRGKESDPIEAETFLLGYGSTLYVSQENLFLAYQITAPVYRVTGEEVTEPRDQTVIHRFAINNGAIDYKATGLVPGYLLNQFSMDEYQKNLRVATTVQGWTSSGSYQYNNVYVLNSGLKVIGTLEFLAPDERIYSTRFMGDRLYMVTFKRIDPLFVIDLSNPTSPGVLGELKIPGYSDYLHPYDSDYIIGIGKETEENQWGGVSVAGLKLALFDVSDVNNPELIDKVEIGKAGTDSEALYEHKAFLFDKQKNLLVIPVREVKRIDITGGKYPSYTQKIWQGAYVFSLTPQTGFVLRGTISHDDDADPYQFWGSPSAVRRSLYINDVLYTISRSSVVMNDLDDIQKKINEIELPSETVNGPYRYPEPGILFID